METPSDDRGRDPRGPGERSAPPEGRAAAFRIAAIYAAVGALWVLFSDLVLDVFVAGRLGFGWQTAKGAAYVVVTAALLYVLIERNRAGIAARDRRLRAVLDGMSDAVFVADRAGRIVDVNAAAQELLAVHPTPARPIELAPLLHSAHVRHADGRPMALHETAAWRALRGETVASSEALFRDARGRDVFVSVSAAPVRGRGAEPEAAVVVMRDISEVKRFEEMREEFIATAAHELKTPLAVVKAYAQLMQRRGQGDPTALAAMTRQADRLTRLVQQLLEVSRFRIGGGDLRAERFDLGQLAEEVVGRMESTGSGRVAIAREPAPVHADRERIAQVVASLLENALRFSPRGGAVDVAITRADAMGVLSVRDRGVGIPAERQARVFERFYRAHAGTAEDYGGLGIGLDMSREIVARHGGRIWFESAEGQGSTFSFSLPLASEEAR